MAQTLNMPPTPLSRVLGILGIIGGLGLLFAFIAEPLFIQISPDLFNLRLILFNIGAIAVVLAVHLRQSAVSPRLSLVGAIPTVLANAAYMVVLFRAVAQPGEIGAGDYGPYFMYFGAAMWLSDLWFALVTFRLGVLSRISAAALAFGSLGAFAGMGVFGEVDPGSLYENVVFVGFFLLGLGWILLGLEVALRRRPAPLADG